MLKYSVSGELRTVCVGKCQGKTGIENIALSRSLPGGCVPNDLEWISCFEGDDSERMGDQHRRYLGQ